MHDGSEPYWKTPERIKDQHAPLDPSTHAERLSR